VNDILLAILIFVGVTLLVLALAAGFLAWRVWRSEERRLAKRISKMPFGDKIAFGRGLLGDPRVPLGARIIALALVLYLASPIDLLPDFIPVLGFLDDILIVIIGANLILRSVPDYVIEEHLQRYEQPRLPEQRRLPSPQR
jgi:uncharacterized membrane protein YkvA (DUF1232 family)